jgi:isochorismate hydrolase
MNSLPLKNRVAVPRAVAIVGAALLALASYKAEAQLPDPGMVIDPQRTAVLITDPQNDFLSPDGVTWGVVGESVTENNTVANIDSLMKAAKANSPPIMAGNLKAHWKP